MFKLFLLNTAFFCLLNFTGYAQPQEEVTVRGVVVTPSGTPIARASVALAGTRYGTTTDEQGQFDVKAPVGNYTLLVACVGYAAFEVRLHLRKESMKPLKVVLKESKVNLDEVDVVGKTQVQALRETGFSVESVETADLQNQSIQLNRILDWTPGVRVRQEGGMGSNYNYSLNGMSGNAVTFFIDGIPMEYFGSSYTINNLPVSLIKRIDVYKGVVPVDLGSDALGGAIHVVSDSKRKRFLETSYSYGSFNTHQAVVHGQYSHSASHFTTRVSAFYTHSDNNYNVWGQGVNYADASTGFKAVDFTKENPATRFNDQFQTFNGKVDVGFVDKKWADQFFVSLLASTQRKGIQTGQTMATVYGKLHYKEVLLMPHLSYQKENLFTDGLTVSLFSGYSNRKGETIDTAMAFYNWKGETTPHEQGGGEISRNGKSWYTLYEDSWINRINVTYRLPAEFKLGFNYFNSSAKRHGKDPYVSAYRVPHIAPQNIHRQFAGLSLETKKFDERLYVNTFLKWYDFKTTSNELEYFIVDGEYQATAVPIKNNKSNWGGGIAASYKFHPLFLTKFSVEQATRLPTPTEALGNGVLVTNNPNIKPEQSLNINLGLVWGRIPIGSQQGLTVTAGVFYRDTKDQLLYMIASRDDGIYENVGQTLGKGVELAMVYDLNHWLKVNANMTYLDIRNNQRLEDGVPNIIYGDRLRNTPYLLGNAGISANIPNSIQGGSKLFAYLHANYLHEFYLYWPSLGTADTKNIIPSQLVYDLGVGYTLPGERISVALDLSNVTNTQAYDNFLLQKPGRAAFIKLKYQLAYN
ncbi:TonB-dependent receptor [Parapedobacter pyrenivorans]|uniref:TonB-dependent receptor n=1 Tax=Parapedobacter pyrenivorans TaxID=1305674 RepID=A0A917MGX0_9SPHI|nr:TonB-dependent receptor plug domain-containing protein [Parapedobacter pyrenivorans]GGH02033.1 TonB-dependent receptor [Parapedobacter pyrenivorans]